MSANIGMEDPPKEPPTSGGQKKMAREEKTARDMQEKTKRAAARALSEGQKLGEEIEAAAEEIRESAEEGLRQGMEAMTKYSREGFDAFTRNYEELTRFNRDAADMLMEMATRATKHMENMREHMTSFVRTQMDDSMQGLQNFSRAGSMKEMMEAHNELTRLSFQHCVEHCMKLGDLSLRITEESLGPLNERVRAAMERLGRVQEERSSK